MFTPDPAQRLIVQAPTHARLVVDAGPGTGKTATAAARVLALLEAGMPPGNLWMVSFSRAAVLEMRQRLIAFGADPQAMPRVTTLDSLAWRLREADLDADSAVLEGHDAAIAETLEMMRVSGSQIRTQLARIGHVLLDETQDFVGARALLIVELVGCLPAVCGVTILTDEAQAIYGFAGAAASAALDGDTVARHLLSSQDYQHHTLTQIHRTDRQKLLRVFADTRRVVMRQTADPARKLARVRRTILRKARRPFWIRQNRADDGDTLILYRSRAEVLAEATARAGRTQPFRLRLSGLPAMLHPWIASTLADYDAQFLSRIRFLDLWRDRAELPDSEGEQAWAALCEGMGSTERIEMRRLLSMLRSVNPPPSLCRLDPGDGQGPVIGTIHASKGREMPAVRLMMPVESKGRDDPESEARVLFVGATRARTTLELGVGMRLAAKRLSSGRVYIPGKAGQCRCEIGRDADIDWLAGYRETADFETLLRRLKVGQALKIVFDAKGFRIEDRGIVLGCGSRGLMAELRELRSRVERQVEYGLFGALCGDAHFLGLRTLAVDPAAMGNTVGKTGLYLVPSVAGLITMEFYVL